MKKNFTPLTLNSIATAVGLFAVSLLFSCKTEPAAEVNVGSFRVYNVSPTLSTYDVYINDKKFNSGALPFGGGVKYATLAAGSYDIKFTTAGESQSVLTANGVTIGKNLGHSLFLVGVQPNLDKVYMVDEYPNAEMKKSYVRFVNLSEDAPALELTMNDTSLVANKTYKSYSDFMPINPGNKVFAIKDASSTKTTLESTKLSGGHFYTIISRGKLNPANEFERSFSGQIIINQ